MTKLALGALLLGAFLMRAQNGTQPPSASVVGTGADLARKCSEVPPPHSVDDGVNQAYSRGYCFGALTTAAELLDSDGHIHFPEGATFAQIQKIVMNYLNAHPEEWQKAASLVVKKALRQAWGT